MYTKIVFLAAVSAVLLGVMSGHTASAVNDITVNSRLHHGNTASYCAGDVALGMVWLSNDEDNYYAETVTIPTNATSAAVSIRGAVNSCTTNWRPLAWVDMWAIDVNTAWVSGIPANATLYRGRISPTNENSWSSVGGKLYGTLNVAGVAPCTGTGASAQQAIFIDIARRQYQTRSDGSTYWSASVGIESVPVVVSRTCPTWTTSSQSQVKLGTTTLGTDTGWQTGLGNVQPGNVLNYKHTLTVGSANMPAAAVIQNAVVRGMDPAAPNNGIAQRQFNNNPPFYPSPLLFPDDYTALTRVANLRGNNGATIANFGNYSAGTSGDRSKTIYTVTQVDVGNRLCQRLDWGAPAAYNNPGYANSSGACAVVPYNYALHTTVSSLPGSVETGQPVSLTGTVGFTNSPTKSRPATGDFYRLVFPVGATQGAVQADRYYAGDACAFYTGESMCDVVGSTGSRVWGPTTGTSPATSWTENIMQSSVIPDTLEPGDRVCFAFMIRRGADGPDPVRSEIYNSNRAYISVLQCTTVGKKPQAQVWGGGLQVGRTYAGTFRADASVRTSLTVSRRGSAETIFGSWSEYGIFAPSSIAYMASGSGLNNGSPDSAQSAWSAYTFTKRTDGGPNSYGNYTSTNAALSNIATAFPIAFADTVVFPSNTLNLSTATKERSIRPTDGAARNLTLTADPGTTFGDGQWLVINATGHNITIANNITYATGPFTRTAQIPQLIIIADNITINSDVTNVDAWLIARDDATRAGANGAIATCHEQSVITAAASQNGVAQWLSTGTNYTSDNARLTLNHCANPLRINGPVIANQLYLRRTAGSGAGATAGQPAEVINLRPDTYLWAREHMSPRVIYQSVSETELPPRY